MMERERQAEAYDHSGKKQTEGELVHITPTDEGNVYQVRLKGSLQRDGKTFVLTTPRPVALEDAG